MKTVWKNKWKILEGIWNTWFPSRYIKNVAEKRSMICQANICGLYDKFGTAEATYVKGKPACGGCGCNEKYKVHSLSSHCYLKDLGLTPLWEAEMTEKEEEIFRNKTGIKND